MKETFVTLPGISYLHYHERKALEGIVEAVALRYALIDAIILFGSKARGDFLEYSDVDLLFVMQHVISRDMKSEMHDMLYEFEVEQDVTVSAVFVTAEDYGAATTPFLKTVRAKGVVIWSRG